MTARDPQVAPGTVARAQRLRALAHEYARAAARWEIDVDVARRTVLEALDEIGARS